MANTDGAIKIHSLAYPTLVLSVARVSNYMKVRVHLKEAGILSLGAVQVLDFRGVDMALNQPATQSSQRRGSEFPASNAVDGNPDSFTHTSEDEEGEPNAILSLSADHLSQEYCLTEYHPHKYRWLVGGHNRRTYSITNK